MLRAVETAEKGLSSTWACTSSFKEHLEFTKTGVTPGALSRMLLSTRGPKQATRKLLTSVVTSQMLYAAPVWAKPRRKHGQVDFYLTQALSGWLLPRLPQALRPRDRELVPLVWHMHRAAADYTSGVTRTLKSLERRRKEQTE
ncbi:GL26937 [Drosophila persimilis]|uniref:GL26937 n=1 Tax=Drosophila persimilis TaxID=7234 RepID=B4HC81_DROPE|nr:GL26937 [Drosophila persimilis]